MQVMIFFFLFNSDQKLHNTTFLIFNKINTIYHIIILYRKFQP